MKSRQWLIGGCIALLFPSGGAGIRPVEAIVSGRSCHAMAFSPIQKAVVLYGGARVCGQQVLADSALWAWDGGSWSSRAAAGPTPGPREDVLLVHDSRRNRLVLYGGRNGPQVFEDTWEWDGTSWLRRASSGGPGKLEHAAAAFDENRGRVVVFGGGSRSAGNPFRDTWEWDGTVWTRALSGAGPAARVGHSMAWSSSDRAVLLYGGFAESGSFRDLWRWDGTSWAVLHPAGPTDSEGPALLNGGQLGVVLVGPGVADGAAQDAPLSAWAWKGSRWELLGSPGPPARVGQALSYDAHRQRIVFFGGFRLQTSQPLDDLWEFDGSEWRRQVKRDG